MRRIFSNALFGAIVGATTLVASNEALDFTNGSRPTWRERGYLSIIGVTIGAVVGAATPVFDARH